MNAVASGLAKMCTEVNVNVCLQPILDYGIQNEALPVIFGKVGIEKVCRYV